MTGQVTPIEIMALPFAECLVLVGIHSYLGLHVLRRKVIFVDLALAQVAALGTTVAFLFGFDPLSRGAYIFSLLFTFLGAAVFALTRLRKDRVPQEAVIGLVYAQASAIGILMVARAPHGAEHITQILTGVLFYVKPHEVLAAAIVYSFVGLFHYVFRRQFLAISEDPEKAREDGLNVRLWDFLFYMSFGLVITHSVRTAGVLLVFVFLVVPAILATLVTSDIRYQLAIGWSTGFLVAAGGLGLSYWSDSAPGPTVVTFYGAILLVAALAIYIFRSDPGRFRRAANVAGGVAIAVLIAAAFWGMGTWLSNYPFWTEVEHAHSPSTQAGADGPAHRHTHQHDGAGHPGETESSGVSPADTLFSSLSDLDIEAKKARLANIGDADLLEAVLQRAPASAWELRLALGLRLLALDRAAGAETLVDLLEQPCAPLLRDEALQALKGRSHDDFGYDPWSDPAAGSNPKAMEKWKAWVRETGK